MIKNIKAVILIIVGAVAISALSGLFMLKELEKANRVKSEELLSKEEILKKKAEELLSSLLSEVDLIQNRVTEKKKELASFESELANYKRQARSAQQEITGIENRAASAETKIGQLKIKIAELQARIVDITKDKLKLTGELTLLQKTTDALREHLSRRLEEEKHERRASRPVQNLAKSGADTSKEPQPLKPSLTGEVLIVNREFDFVIISLGQNDGIEEGMVLELSRDDNILSKARVETARRNISAAALADKEAISRIRAGDKALFYSGTGAQMAK